MSRAQEIRQKRLNEKNNPEEIANKLYDWVLDLLENPTEFNTGICVCLVDTPYHKIRIGSDQLGLTTNKKFDVHVMQILADRFDQEEGYYIEPHLLEIRDARNSLVIGIDVFYKERSSCTEYYLEKDCGCC